MEEFYTLKRKDVYERSLKEVRAVLRSVNLMIVLFLILLVVVPILAYINQGKANTIKDDEEITQREIQSIPEDFIIEPFDDSEEGKMAEYGHRLITETYAYIGPDTKIAITGNRLSCSSCHLNGGTKPFAAPYVGLCGIFPIYIGRENKVVSLEERINGCFERSMNGRPVDVNSKEMRAIVSYIKHISKNTPIGKRIIGQGFVDFEAPGRPANVHDGKLVYQSNCKSCHGEQGQGVKGNKGNREGGYIYPPLWGTDSYNDGAGMARLLTAARFIKGNMPLGVTHESPILSDEEAYDVAAYINSFSRPQKANKELDYPDLTKKPKDCPYPPYSDDIPQAQHKLGPYNFAKK